MIIAILSLQGAFAEHQQMLLQLGAETIQIRNIEDWNRFISLPVGQSSRYEGNGESLIAGQSSHYEGKGKSLIACQSSRFEGKGLIIPGGESTAMLRIMKDEQLLEPVRNAISEGLPVFGTCAGMILLAKKVEGEERERLATMGITVRRNAYGRQLGSFYAEHEMKGIGVVPMTFIRAPYIENVEEGVEILSELDGHIIAAREKNMLVCSFHPELNDDTRIHEAFLQMVK